MPSSMTRILLVVALTGGCHMLHSDAFCHELALRLSPSRHQCPGKGRMSVVVMAAGGEGTEEAGVAARASVSSGSEGDGPKRLFIFGVGYTGFGLVRAAQARWGDGVRLYGTCRTPGETSPALKRKVSPVDATIQPPDTDEYTFDLSLVHPSSLPLSISPSHTSPLLSLLPV